MRKKPLDFSYMKFEGYIVYYFGGCLTKVLILHCQIVVFCNFSDKKITVLCSFVDYSTTSNNVTCIMINYHYISVTKIFFQFLNSIPGHLLSLIPS